MTTEEIKNILDNTESKWSGDNAIEGLLILQKYFEEYQVMIRGAEKDIIFSVDVNHAIECGITREDITALGRLNWMIKDNCFSCFV